MVELVSRFVLDYHPSMRWRRFFRSLKHLILFFLFIISIAPEWPAFGNETYQLNALVGLRQFDFLVWEIQALSVKAEAALTRDHTYLDETVRRQIVMDYLALVQDVGLIEWEIEQIYSDPDIPDPAAASLDLQRELAQKRAALEDIQPVAEAIVQDQIADVLREEQFALLQQAWPPVMMHMTPLPTILIVSPRDRIERKYGIPLAHGLSIPEREALETAVFEQLNLSALVVPIGGLGIYPSMIMETGNINWLAEVTAHEWAHLWMGPHPISLYYGVDHQVRTMNETTASIAGVEIGAQMIARYYPELAPPPPPDNPPALQPEPDPPPFDFRAEMAATRIRADELLAAGQIDEAEAYLEERRQLFVANGHHIRKLNQAYFAFHGAYADEPGATGADPVGPLVREARALAPSLRAFLEAMAPVNSLEELREVVEGMERGRMKDEG